MQRAAIIRKLEDLHNELAHVRAFPHYYESYTEALMRRVAVTKQICELLKALQSLMRPSAT